MDVVDLGSCRVHLMSVVRGLVSEADAVRAAFLAVKPDAIALSIGREELEGLRAHGGESVPPENIEEEVYVHGLSRFGEVRKPPPCFVDAVAVAKEAGVPVHPLDMDSEQYTTAYLKAVSTVDVLRSNVRQVRLKGWESTAASAADFVLEWDALVNGSAGYRELQSERETFLARRLQKLASRYRVLLGIVEVERARGVLGRLV